MAPILGIGTTLVRIEHHGPTIKSIAKNFTWWWIPTCVIKPPNVVGGIQIKKESRGPIDKGYGCEFLTTLRDYQTKSQRIFAGKLKVRRQPSKLRWVGFDSPCPLIILKLQWYKIVVRIHGARDWAPIVRKVWPTSDLIRKMPERASVPECTIASGRWE